MPTIRQSMNTATKKKIRSSAVKQLHGCPQRRGVVSKVRIVAPKKPNSARRKVARVKLSTGSMVTARLIGQGHNLQNYSHVLVRGGRANDLIGVRYTMVKGKLDFS
ncbi:MAG TPA: 30S ribosomal protein S12 [Saprospiraceae bacterium]|nr:30S ribosomal protein S12 [Saprospiraceae bacterium]